MSLALGFGAACKSLDRYLFSTKEYIANGRLGERFDTDDTTGKLVEKKSWDHVTEEQLRLCLQKSFSGNILQVPPAYSAISVNGRRLYDLARLGKTPEIAARPVSILKIELVASKLPDFTIKVECGSGTYMRSLIRDLGAQLGTVGVMTDLVRTKHGDFQMNDTLEIVDFSKKEKILEKLQNSNNAKFL